MLLKDKNCTLLLLNLPHFDSFNFKLALEISYININENSCCNIFIVKSINTKRALYNLMFNDLAGNPLQLVCGQIPSARPEARSHQETQPDSQSIPSSSIPSHVGPRISVRPSWCS